ncbi:MAG TPA: YqeG family HAD IIIA-type phosphatase [Lachnospiraceae bacterium]|nr:YqeG family HAD IIIA-type phosphatase [Lachnospiraceae bacterium]
MLEKLYPDDTAASTYDIDFEQLYREGIRGIIFDIDNTLVPHDAPADKRAVGLFRRLKKIGFKCCLVSNNKKQRVDMFNREVHVFTLENAHKPSRKAYRKAMHLMGTNTASTISIGDQIFTDIWGANRAGIRTILVGQIAKKEEFQIVLKRYLEKIVIHFYKRKTADK